MEVNVNYNKCKIEDLDFGDVFIVDNVNYPYMLTDNDTNYCKVKANEYLCIALSTGTTTTLNGDDEVTVVKNVELNYSL
jgi:hypothetical protein